VAAEPVIADGAGAHGAASAATRNTDRSAGESDASGRSAADSCASTDAKHRGVEQLGSAAAPPGDRSTQAAYEASLMHVTLKLECDTAWETRVSMYCTLLGRTCAVSVGTPPVHS
jgi:hypothetical protein